MRGSRREFRKAELTRKTKGGREGDRLSEIRTGTVIASEAKQSSAVTEAWIASSLRFSQ